MSVAMQKWLPWEIVSNHLGQEMKHHKSILYDDFMHLSITQTCPCNIQQYFMAVKIVIFQMKKCDVFLIFAQNIDCGYTLKPPQ